MPITNAESGTNVHEIAPQIFRISTPVPPSAIPGGFTFNQILVVDEEPRRFSRAISTNGDWSGRYAQATVDCAVEMSYM